MNRTNHPPGDFRGKLSKRVLEFAALLDEDMKNEGYPARMSRKQVAQALGRSLRSMDRYCQNGTLRPFRLRADLSPYFRRADIALLFALHSEVNS